MLSEEIFAADVVLEYKVSVQPDNANTRGVNKNKPLKFIG